MIFWPGERIFARIVPILFNWLSYFTASSVSLMGGWVAGWSSVEYHVSCVCVLPASKCALCLQNDWIRISNCRILTRSIFMSVEYLHLILVIVCECHISGNFVTAGNSYIELFIARNVVYTCMILSFFALRLKRNYVIAIILRYFWWFNTKTWMWASWTAKLANMLKSHATIFSIRKPIFSLSCIFECFDII